MSALNLYADEAASKLVSADGGTPVLGRWVLGDQKLCTLRVVEQSDAIVREVNLHVRTVAASLGLTMEPPTGGTFKLKVADPDDEETVYESSAIAYNATDTVLQAALDAMLATLTWTTTVELPLDPKGAIVPSCWLVKVTGPENPPAVLQVLENALRPTSFVRIRAFQRDGDVWWHEIRLIEAPLAWNEDGFERVLPDPPTVTRVLAGRGETSTEPPLNEIQSLNLPADFRGTYFFRWNYRASRVLGINDGPDEIAAALNAMFKDGQKRFEVTLPESDHAHIEFGGDLQGASQDLMTIEVASFPPGVMTFALNLDRAEMHGALRAVKEIEVPFEIELEVVDDPDDLDNPAVPGRIVTLCQEPVKVYREQKWRELGTVQAIDWLRPPTPRSYVPFTADQVITGQQHYSAAIGDGVTTEWSLGHNLGTEAIAGITVRQNTTPGLILGQGTEYTVRIEGEDEVVLFFAAAPALNSLVVTVTTAGPVSAFQAHTHTIAQITGLQAALDALGARVTDLEDMAPGITFSAPASAAASRTILLPARSEIYPGRFATTPDPKNPKLKAGGLLPALHDATVTSFAALPLGDAGANAGSVFQNTTGATISIPGGLGRRAALLRDQEFFGSDGRLWYRLTRDASTTSYFPTDLERELWKVAINDKQLRAGQRLTIACQVALQMLVATTQMQCFLVIEIGTAPSQTSPATTGPNLENVVWDATPLLAQRLILGDVEETHQFGCTIARAADGTMSADASLYDAAIAAANTPETANFVLRARLTRFDTENRFDATTGANSARGLIRFQSSGRGEIQ